MLDIYATLEIHKVLESVASYAHSEISKNRILNLKMTGDRNELKHNLDLVDEMMSCSLRHNNPPIDVSFDLGVYLEIAKKSGVLSPLELDHIALDIETANKITEYFYKVEKEKYPLLVNLAKRLYDESPIALAIHKCIAPNLSIRDDASPKLNSIRHSIVATEKKVRDQSGQLISKYKEYLSDNTVTIRNDHFVLPVKSSNKHLVSGVIHDVSDTGMTTFIEPQILIELSNELYVLKSQEREEINRILKELTAKVASAERELLSNNKVIAELDFVTSKANYGNERNGFIATLSEDRVLSIKNARHPLIEDSKAVRNSFELNKKQRIIIISGPNAGGKTVALKTLGLVVMMNQMAIPVLTTEAPTLPFFPRIYADIGDNQSLADNLSTFAAHISNLSTITYFVSAKDLVLIDELGTGTSPNEGESIAISVTKFLLEKGTYGLISSHFEAMKEFGYANEGAINAMMVFDDKKLLPTYSLRIGLPGRSYGLEMAKRYHLDEEVVKNAKEYLDKHESSDFSETLYKLEKSYVESENIRNGLLAKQAEFERREKILTRETERLEERKESFEQELEKMRDEMIESAREQIDEILAALKGENVTTKDITNAKKNLNNLIKDEPVIISNEVINIGDTVKTDLGFIGKVTKVKGNNLELLTIDGMSIKVDKNRVKKTIKADTPKMPKRDVDSMVASKTNVRLELNVIGYHIDEAIPVVSKYLDDCRIKRFKQVRIIHGMGTGQLRTAIWNYLKTCDFIEEYHYGGYSDGGSGATIIIFK